uniref:Putative secreted protein n=1 Tax=Anopheles triannulatus TaxID=58253 RepID=A0A2M4B276_9DIPT
MMRIGWLIMLSRAVFVRIGHFFVVQLAEGRTVGVQLLVDSLHHAGAFLRFRRVMGHSWDQDRECDVYRITCSNEQFCSCASVSPR